MAHGLSCSATAPRPRNKSVSPALTGRFFTTEPPRKPRALFFLIGVLLLYNAVLVSAVHWSESTICIHISPVFWTTLATPIPSVCAAIEHRAGLPALQSSSPLAVSLHLAVRFYWVCRGPMAPQTRS